MSEKTEKLQSAYAQLLETEGGKHLMNWITTTADDTRRKAIKGKTEYELGRADGLEEVKEYAETWRNTKK